MSNASQGHQQQPNTPVGVTPTVKAELEIKPNPDVEFEYTMGGAAQSHSDQAIFDREFVKIALAELGQSKLDRRTKRLINKLLESDEAPDKDLLRKAENWITRLLGLNIVLKPAKEEIRTVRGKPAPTSLEEINGRRYYQLDDQVPSTPTTPASAHPFGEGVDQPAQEKSALSQEERAAFEDQVADLKNDFPNDTLFTHGIVEYDNQFAHLSPQTAVNERHANAIRAAERLTERVSKEMGTEWADYVKSSAFDLQDAYETTFADGSQLDSQQLGRLKAARQGWTDAEQFGQSVNDDAKSLDLGGGPSGGADSGIAFEPEFGPSFGPSDGGSSTN